MQKDIPIITIDGPGGTGKGTTSCLLAKELGFHFLDSGVLYRVLGLAARQKKVALDDEVALVALVAQMNVRFIASGVDGSKIFLYEEDVTSDVRSELCSRDASVVAILPGVRLALLNQQRAFCKMPGLVADGRDMGTVVFPHATLKIFLTASREERARRRYKQLRGKGIGVTLDHLLAELESRDARDSQRKVAPMVAASDAVIIDTTTLTVDEVLGRVRILWQKLSVG